MPPGSATKLAFSLIIPAYNEFQRLPPYLESIRSYIGQQFHEDCEVIVVDDGSTDQTRIWLTDLGQRWSQLRYLPLPTNCGKGAAVRRGVLAARGDRILYADADGATPIDQERALRRAIDEGADIAVGSRLVRAAGVKRNRQWHRALVGRAFARAAHLVLKLPVRDTQCGFKMLRAEAARRLFEMSTENGYLFDLEILALARRCGYCVEEVPITWSDQPGSRLKMHRECFRIARGLWRLRRKLARLSPDTLPQ